MFENALSISLAAHVTAPAPEPMVGHPCLVAREAEILGEIVEDGVLLARWERSAHPAAGPALRALLESRHPAAIDTTSRDEEDFLGELRAIVGVAIPEVDASLRVMAADACGLASHFAGIIGRDHLRLRFERVEDDGCALFHVDTLSVRMLCTYVGPGTQWLEEDNVRREQLGSRGRTLDEANAAIVVDPARIRTAPAWHVLVFKGRSWDGHGYRDGLVHRSAPVRRPQDNRLRLTVDLTDSCPC